MVLLGNKSDLNAIREVDTVRAQTWARSHGIRPYEVTVMNRDSLKDPFCYITWRMANPGEAKHPLLRRGGYMHWCIWRCPSFNTDLFRPLVVTVRYFELLPPPPTQLSLW